MCSFIIDLLFIYFTLHVNVNIVIFSVRSMDDVDTIQVFQKYDEMAQLIVRLVISVF